RESKSLLQKMSRPTSLLKQRVMTCAAQPPLQSEPFALFLSKRGLQGESGARSKQGYSFILAEA
ncbi:MAG: hypothetical protein WAK48_12530, partial [Candidatus Acidiferrum sp.]